MTYYFLLDLPNLQSLQVGRSDFWCSLYAFSQQQGLTATNGYEVYSMSTKLTIPLGGCNDESIQELRFDGYSNMKELEIGDNSFIHTNRVFIEKMNELESITIGRGSFGEQFTDYSPTSSNTTREIHIRDCRQLGVISIDPESFVTYDQLDLQSRKGWLVVNRFTHLNIIGYR